MQARQALHQPSPAEELSLRALPSMPSEDFLQLGMVNPTRSPAPGMLRNGRIWKGCYLSYPRAGPNYQWGRGLKETAQLAVQLSFPATHSYCSLFYGSVCSRRNPLDNRMMLKTSEWKQPGQGEHTQGSTGVQLLASFLGAEESLEDAAYWTGDCKRI